MRQAAWISAVLFLASLPVQAAGIQWGSDPSQPQGWRPTQKPAATAPQVPPSSKTQFAPPSKLGPKTISTQPLTLFGTDTGPVTLLTPAINLIGTHGGPTSMTTAALTFVGTHGGPLTMTTAQLTLVGTRIVEAKPAAASGAPRLDPVRQSGKGTFDLPKGGSFR